jgi:hypothetical protein
MGTTLTALDLVLVAVFGVGAYVAAHLVRRFLLARAHREFDRWQSELSHDAMDLVNAHLWVVRCHLRVAERIGQMPEDFEAPMFMAAGVGQWLERSVLVRAQEMGLLTPDLQEAVSALARSAPASIPPLYDADEARSEAGTDGARPPIARWRDGELVPPGRKALSLVRNELRSGNAPWRGKP